MNDPAGSRWVPPTPEGALAVAVARARREGLAPLWTELARRLAASDRPPATVALRALDESQRHAIADLLGLARLPAADTTLRLDRVSEALGVHPDDLRSVVEAIHGPVVSRAAARREDRYEREALWSWLAEEAAALGIEVWAARVRRLGVPAGDVAGHRARLAAAVRVLQALTPTPSEPRSLADLAADLAGDSHALDPGTAVATLVLDALAHRFEEPPPKSAEDSRALWSRAGVVVDELSSTVLLLGLRAVGPGPLAVALNAFAATAVDSAESTAVSITLAQLRRWPVAPDPRLRDVLVVENPSLVAYAATRARLPADAVVCTSGWPNVAVMTLLRQLAAAGCRLHCHADFDVAGILITRFLVDRLGAAPWRMTENDYEAAVDTASVAITASVPDTPWDPRLADAMRRHRLAVFEESVRRDLFG